MKSMRLAAAVAMAAACSVGAQEPVKRGYLGVSTVPINAGGELIVQLDPQGAAAAAGFKVGDAIVELDGKRLSAADTLQSLMRSRAPGKEIEVSVRDASGGIVDRKVTVRERMMFGPGRIVSQYGRFDDDDMGLQTPRFDEMIQQAQFAQPQFAQPQFGQPPMGPPRLGVRILDVDPARREQLKLGAANGAVIAEVIPGSAAAEAKLQTNDVVTAIDGQAVTNAGDVLRAVAAAKPDGKVTLKVLRDGKAMDLPVTFKSPPMQATPRFPPGLQPTPGTGEMGGGGRIDLLNEINALKQRVSVLEAKIAALEVPGSDSSRTPAPLPKTGTAPPPAKKP